MLGRECANMIVEFATGPFFLNFFSWGIFHESNGEHFRYLHSLILTLGGLGEYWLKLIKPLTSSRVRVTTPTRMKMRKFPSENRKNVLLVEEVCSSRLGNWPAHKDFFLLGNVIDIYSYVTDLYNLRGAWQSGFPVAAHIILHRECCC